MKILIPFWIIYYLIADLFSKNKRPGLGKSGVIKRHARLQGLKVIDIKIPRWEPGPEDKLTFLDK
jgi:hypothetical protein